MKKFKQYVALILAMLMVLDCMPTGLVAYADEPFLTTVSNTINGVSVEQGAAVFGVIVDGKFVAIKSAEIKTSPVNYIETGNFSNNTYAGKSLPGNSKGNWVYATSTADLEKETPSTNDFKVGTIYLHQISSYDSSKIYYVVPSFSLSQSYKFWTVTVNYVDVENNNQVVNTGSETKLNGETHSLCSTIASMPEGYEFNGTEASCVSDTGTSVVTSTKTITVKVKKQTRTITYGYNLKSV